MVVDRCGDVSLASKSEILRRENEVLRAQVREFIEAQEKDDALAEREAVRRKEKELRTASDWGDAFDKQAVLIQRELRAVPGQEDDPYFCDLSSVNARARVLWQAKQCELRALRSELLSEVAYQLGQEFSDSAPLRELCGWLRRDEPSGYLDW